MSCNCHPYEPCGYCKQSLVCDGCGKMRYGDNLGVIEESGTFLCSGCFEELEDIDPEGHTGNEQV